MLSTQKTVKTDRERYIGGSDIPAVMGISPFESRMDLLLEKAGLKDRNFSGNRYTEYGVTMEPKIRDYINENGCEHFIPSAVYNGIYRGNTDGLGEKSILEVKTTSIIYDHVEDYETYLMQMELYMWLFHRESGLLAVYERPDDFSESFDRDRLHLYRVAQNPVRLKEIRKACVKFWRDLRFLKSHPLAEEEELPSRVEIAPIAMKAVQLERELATLKQIEKQCKDVKAKLKDAMTKYGVKSYETPNGTKITLVPDGEDSTVTEFDAEKFEAAHPALWKQYQRERVKKGRAGYVKITLPRGAHHGS